MKVIQALIISGFLLGTCIAYPNMAGHCKSGSISDHAPSLHGAIGDGNLDNGNYFLNSNENGILDSAADASLSTGVDHYISLNGVDGATFRGFLFRLSGADGADATGLMTITDASSPDSLNMNGCGSGSSGISHNNKSDKSTVDIIIRSDQPIDLVLEVTVVEKNNSNEKNHWHYEKFDLKLEAQATVSPTAPQPTANPTTSEPSPSPSAHPSGNPTTSGAPTISMNPTVMDSPPTSSAWGFSAWTTLVSATLAAVTAAVVA